MISDVGKCSSKIYICTQTDQLPQLSDSQAVTEWTFDLKKIIFANIMWPNS